MAAKVFPNFVKEDIINSHHQDLNTSLSSSPATPLSNNNNTSLLSYNDNLQQTSDIMRKGNSHLSYYQTIIKPQLNYLFDIDNQEINLQFAKYNFQNISSIFLLYCNILLTILVLPMFIMSLGNLMATSSSSESGHWNAFKYLLPLLGILFWLTAIVSGCLLYFMSITRREEELMRSSSFFQYCVKYCERIQHCYLISLHLVCIGIYLRFHAPGECLKMNSEGTAGNAMISIWNCDPNHDLRGIPNMATFMLLIGPFACCVALRAPRWWMCALCHTMILASFAGGINNQMQFDIGAVIVCWWIAGLIFFYDLHKHYLISFFITHQFKLALAENAKYAEQIQANEMKHMIANVAHDLKTPLASFTSGIEFISHILQDCHDYLEAISAESTVRSSPSKTRDTSLLSSSLLSINNCLNNLRSTNAFMVMAINRCIDYTKASKGMKLVPTYETIQLQEALKLPLNCMKNIQDQCTIELAAIPSEISEAVITDKQWLQENVLCLLSNAVKYSTAGKIGITVSLRKEKDFTSSCVSSGSFAFTENHRSSANQITNTPTSPAQHHQQHPPIVREDHEPDRMKNDHVLDPPKQFSHNILLSDKEENHVQVHLHSSDSAASATFRVKSEVSQLILIEIEDNGIGMTEEAMATLFNPFKQAQRFTGGTGLGLFSLAKRIEALHGKYGVKKRSDGQKGSIFWFAVPYRPDHDISLLETTDSFALKTVSNESRITREFTPIEPFDDGSAMKNTAQPIITPLNILIADDSPPISKMLTMLLERQHHVIQAAQNGDIALQVIESRWRELKEPFDVILMDLQMPVMDGLEATRRLRKMESEGQTWIYSATSSNSSETLHHQHHMVIGMSANSDHDTVTEAYESGVDAFLGKPFSLELFNKTVRNLLNTSRNG